MRKGPAPTWRTWLGRALLALGSLVALDQFVLYTFLADGRLFGRFIAPYEHGLFTEDQAHVVETFEELLANDPERFAKRSTFDPDLGWSAPKGKRKGQVRYDWAGSRLGHTPLYPKGRPKMGLIALVGCSYTFGTEVEDEHTWARALDEAWEGGRFGNFGIGGHGIDQSLLRYRRDIAAMNPSEVWLGFYPPAALRLTSQFPPLYYPETTRTIYFKPRFHVEEGPEGEELVLHPSPAHTPNEVLDLIGDPAALREALGFGEPHGDPWMARTPEAFQARGSHWSHWSAWSRLLLTRRERGGRQIAPLLSDPTSDLFRTCRGIVRTFAAEVEGANRRFRMIVLPGREEILAVSAGQRGYWEPLTDALRAEGIEVLDLTPALVEAGVDGNERFWMRGGHYSPEAHALVAEILARTWPRTPMPGSAGVPDSDEAVAEK